MARRVFKESYGGKINNNPGGIIKEVIILFKKDWPFIGIFKEINNGN